MEYVRKSAVFSDDRKYRYVLGRGWDPDESGPDTPGIFDRQFAIPFIGLNPSTADLEKDDPTVRRCVGFARSWGVPEIVVLNLFALRSTDPSALKGAEDPRGPENDKYLLEFCKFQKAIACWGAGGALHSEGKRVEAMLRAHGCELYHLGLTKEGHPRHPLYLPASAVPVPWTRGE